MRDLFSIVYVLTNPAMPGLVKIGKTDQSNPETRVSQLYTTGVPVPFSIEYACRVPNSTEVETALHRAFDPQRINPRREFFRIDPEQAIAVLRLLNVEDVTSEVSIDSQEVDSASRQAAEKLQKRRSNFNFQEMGIPVDAVLHSVRNDDSVKVIDERSVSYHGQAMSFTAATRLSLDLDYSVQPSPHWEYEGRLIKEYYEETYSYE